MSMSTLTPGTPETPGTPGTATPPEEPTLPGDPPRLSSSDVMVDSVTSVVVSASASASEASAKTDSALAVSDLTSSELEALYKIELPEFEGPLDLLLHLVKKHELSIIDIPIAFITDQYLKMLDLMRALNLDVAGEYLLMAATLAYLKSRELVPPDPAEELAAADGDGDDDSDLDPRQELIRRLLEYQKYKEAAMQLGDRPVTGRNVWPRGASAEEVAGMRVLPGGAPLAEVPVFRLIESLERVLSRAKITATHDVVVDRVSITDRINALVDRLEREGTFAFESCFDFLDQPMALEQLRHQVVVTFLAILEMTRLKLVRLTQADALGAIYVSRSGAELKDVVVADGEYR